MTFIPHWTQAGWLGATITHWFKKRRNRRNGKRLASADDLEALRRRFAK